MSQYPVLVYGTLRPQGGNYDSFLDGFTVSEQVVILPGFEMIGNQGYPYLLWGDREVVFTLADIQPEQYEYVMKRLDSLEGFRSFDSRNNHYDRVLHSFVLNGKEFQAWVYVASEKSARRAKAVLPVIESGDWIQHLIEKEYLLV